jgi:hypothetical protein
MDFPIELAILGLGSPLAMGMTAGGQCDGLLGSLESTSSVGKVAGLPVDLSKS